MMIRAVQLSNASDAGGHYFATDLKNIKCIPTHQRVKEADFSQRWASETEYGKSLIVALGLYGIVYKLKVVGCKKQGFEEVRTH